MVPANSSELKIPGAQWLSDQLQEVVSDNRLNFNTAEARELDKLSIEFQDIFL
jgi:hypothetical protein